MFILQNCFLLLNNFNLLLYLFCLLKYYCRNMKSEKNTYERSKKSDLEVFFDTITKEYCLGYNKETPEFPNEWHDIVKEYGDEEIKQAFKRSYYGMYNVGEKDFFVGYLKIADMAGGKRNSMDAKNFSELSEESKKRLEKFYNLIKGKNKNKTQSNSASKEEKLTSKVIVKNSNNNNVSNVKINNKSKSYKSISSTLNSGNYRKKLGYIKDMAMKRKNMLGLHLLIKGKSNQK